MLPKISEEQKKVLFYGVAAAIATLPLGMVILISVTIFKAGFVSVKTEAVEFEVSGKGKELTAVSAEQHNKLQQDFKQLNDSFEALKQAAKNKKVDKVLRPQLDKVNESVGNAGIRLNDVKESSEQLNEFVEEAIAEP